MNTWNRKFFVFDAPINSCSVDLAGLDKSCVCCSCSLEDFLSGKSGWEFSWCVQLLTELWATFKIASGKEKWSASCLKAELRFCLLLSLSLYSIFKKHFDLFITVVCKLHGGNSHYLTDTFLVKRLGVCTFSTWEWKGLWSWSPTVQGLYLASTVLYILWCAHAVPWIVQERLGSHHCHNRSLLLRQGMPGLGHSSGSWNTTPGHLHFLCHLDVLWFWNDLHAFQYTCISTRSIRTKQMEIIEFEAFHLEVLLKSCSHLLKQSRINYHLWRPWSGLTAATNIVVLVTKTVAVAQLWSDFTPTSSPDRKCG